MSHAISTKRCYSMKSFRIVPEIRMCDTFDEFIAGFGLNEKDLILTAFSVTVS